MKPGPNSSVVDFLADSVYLGSNFLQIATFGALGNLSSGEKGLAPATTNVFPRPFTSKFLFHPILLSFAKTTFVPLSLEFLSLQE